jgi:hypothetical protein
MEPTKETGVQEKPWTEVVSEKIAPFKEKLNPRVVELMTADRTKEKDYKVEVRDAESIPGIVGISETWDGGERYTNIVDQRYQPSSEMDGWRPGNVDVFIPLGREHGQLARERIDTHIKADGSLTQEIVCSVPTAIDARYDGKGALMSGEFFKYVRSGPDLVVANTLIAPDGKVSTRKYWSKDEWTGNDRYQTIEVTEENGVVKYGSGVHGIMLGYHPPMGVVGSSAQK